MTSCAALLNANSIGLAAAATGLDASALATETTVLSAT